MLDLVQRAGEIGRRGGAADLLERLSKRQLGDEPSRAPLWRRRFRQRWLVARGLERKWDEARPWNEGPQLAFRSNREDECVQCEGTD